MKRNEADKLVPPVLMLSLEKSHVMLLLDLIPGARSLAPRRSCTGREEMGLLHPCFHSDGREVLG